MSERDGKVFWMRNEKDFYVYIYLTKKIVHSSCLLAIFQEELNRYSLRFMHMDVECTCTIVDIEKVFFYFIDLHVLCKD